MPPFYFFIFYTDIPEGCDNYWYNEDSLMIPSPKFLPWPKFVLWISMVDCSLELPGGDVPRYVELELFDPGAGHSWDREARSNAVANS